MGRIPVVAVINTNPDLVELLKDRIEAAGLVVFVMHIADLRAGLDVGAIFDSARSRSHCVRRGRTTQSQLAIPRTLERNRVQGEILDDGGDIDAIVQAVREAVRARPTS